MTKIIKPDMIEWISRNWEDRRRAGEVQELIEAIVAELKNDYRTLKRKHRPSPAEQAHWEGLIADVQDQMFWDKLDHLLNDFQFEF